MNSQGVCPDALEEALKSHSDSFKQWNETRPRPYWAMVYLMPTFHNPTGYCLSPGTVTYNGWISLHLIVTIIEGTYFCVFHKLRLIINLKIKYRKTRDGENAHTCSPYGKMLKLVCAFYLKSKISTR